MKCRIPINGFLTWTVLGLLLTGCKVSLSGISIPEAANTVSVENFENQAAQTNPSFPQQITEEVRQRFLSQTRLQVINSNGDLGFSGSITQYQTQSLALTGNETSALTRLNISVKVKFDNRLNPDKSFEKTFSRFADFQANQPLSAVESALLQEISEQLVQDIFNEAFLDWGWAVELLGLAKNEHLNAKKQGALRGGMLSTAGLRPVFKWESFAAPGRRASKRGRKIPIWSERIACKVVPN